MTTTSSAQQASAPRARRRSLTDHEKEVLLLVCEGLTNARIASNLGVGREAVRSALKRIFRKLGAGNRTRAAALFAQQEGEQRDPERQKPRLTARELQVLRLVRDGRTNSEIATLLMVSKETVKSELKRIFRKVGGSNRTQVAVLLTRNGWI
ncbi:MAG: LuxR C-terminal-related transcriptional regulator [Patescibacteria group bacterium]|jgi:DNA-binding CsgD family transcriptional regulator